MFTETGAEISAHDSYVDHRYERESQKAYPAPWHSWPRFFRNQQDLSSIHVQKELASALRGSRGFGLAVRHAPYLHLNLDDVVRWAVEPIAVVDCFGILQDDDIGRYFALGCEVKALGRGHIQRIKEEVRSSKETRDSEAALPV